MALLVLSFLVSAGSDEVAGASSRRSPRSSLLWQTLSRGFGQLVAQASEQGAAPLPRFLHLAVEAFLRCGLLDHGFLRAACDRCGHQALLPFSCKKRGLCPSCDARRMTCSAMHLVDQVFPEVPLRQWVLSAPFELRPLLARSPRALSALNRLFVEEISRFYRSSVVAPPGAESKTGAVVFVQRFGGSLNLHVHFHVLVPDGVFVRPPGAPISFVPTRPPEAAWLQQVVERVASRMVAWLGRHGHLRASPEDPDQVPLEALQSCLQFAASTGTFARLATPDEADELAPFAHRASSPMSAQALGFSLHAGVRIHAADTEGRERLVRYCARPAICLERLSLLPDGRLAYRLKKPNHRGSTHRVMTPLELVARVIALIPPPCHHLVRYHGVFAPHHAWRSQIVPDAPPSTSEVPCCGEALCRGAQQHLPLDAPEPDAPAAPPPAAPLPPRWSRWVDWATLLARTFGLDALACPRCGGRMRLLEAVLGAERIRWWLAWLRLSGDAEETPNVRGNLLSALTSPQLRLRL